MTTTEYLKKMKQYKENNKIKSSIALFTSIFTDVNNELKTTINTINNLPDIIPYLEMLGCLILSDKVNKSDEQVSILNKDFELKFNNLYTLVQKIPNQFNNDLRFTEASINASISKAVTDIKSSNNAAILDIQNAVKTYSSEDMFNLKNSGKSWNEIAKITGLSKEVIRYRVRAYKTKNNIQ